MKLEIKKNQGTGQFCSKVRLTGGDALARNVRNKEDERKTDGGDRESKIMFSVAVTQPGRVVLS